MKLLRTALSCFALAAVLTASAQITFTVNASANTNTMGYSTGEVYSFVYVLNNYAPATPTGTASVENYFEWKEDTLGQPVLWSTFSGSGLSGSWMQPATNSTSPISYLTAYSNGQLAFFAGTDTGNDTGLTVNGAQLKDVVMWGSYSGLNLPPVTSTLPDPNAYLSDAAGTYPSTGTNFAVVGNGIGGQTAFTIINLTIAHGPSAIPEPSTYAMMLVGVALFAALRRRRA